VQTRAGRRIKNKEARQKLKVVAFNQRCTPGNIVMWVKKNPSAGVMGKRGHWTWGGKTGRAGKTGDEDKRVMERFNCRVEMLKTAHCAEIGVADVRQTVFVRSNVMERGGNEGKGQMRWSVPTIRGRKSEEAVPQSKGKKCQGNEAGKNLRPSTPTCPKTIRPGVGG